MIYIEYPAVFPCPTWAYREEQNAHENRSQFECGWARQRREWQEFDTSVNFSFIMPSTQFDNWSRWVRANGHEWFSIEINPGTPQIMRLTGAVQALYSEFDRIEATVGGEFLNG